MRLESIRFDERAYIFDPEVKLDPTDPYRAHAFQEKVSRGISTSRPLPDTRPARSVYDDFRNQSGPLWRCSGGWANSRITTGF